ncbi:unnamed protein product [Trichogramma brassicae]|uniref:Uncharacterized protein n=1 Tax=Trichogramma brassicae TaxID=86971 RepID=A0A6H5IEG3_9HYME|nr:unnamed protein product [Trichogramma brassicae]
MDAVIEIPGHSRCTSEKRSRSSIDHRNKSSSSSRQQQHKSNGSSSTTAESNSKSSSSSSSSDRKSSAPPKSSEKNSSTAAANNVEDEDKVDGGVGNDEVAAAAAKCVEEDASEVSLAQDDKIDLDSVKAKALKLGPEMTMSSIVQELVFHNKTSALLHAVRAMVPFHPAPPASPGRLSASPHRAYPAPGHTHAVSPVHGQAVPQIAAARRGAHRLPADGADPAAGRRTGEYF